MRYVLNVVSRYEKKSDDPRGGIIERPQDKHVGVYMRVRALFRCADDNIFKAKFYLPEMWRGDHGVL